MRAHDDVQNFGRRLDSIGSIEALEGVVIMPLSVKPKTVSKVIGVFLPKG
jgi:hypothetical protein